MPSFAPKARKTSRTDPAPRPQANHLPVPPIVEEVIQGPGAPLPAERRGRLEAGLGFDFSRVRIHAHDRAAESARAVGARAYTMGPHVVFGSGEGLDTDGGRLLAHELAHVAQQSRGPGLRRSGIGELGSPAEQEADAAAEAVVAGSALAVTQAASGMQRQPAPASAPAPSSDPVKARTLSDLDPVVVDAARAEMKAVGGKSAAFTGIARMLAAEGMAGLDRAGQIEMLKAVRARPEDASYHTHLRRLLAYPSFVGLAGRHRTEVIAAFQKVPGLLPLFFEKLRKTPDQVGLLERMASPEFLALDEKAQKRVLTETPAPAPDAGQKAPTAPLEKTWGDTTVKHVQVDGIRFMIAEGLRTKVDLKKLPPIAAGINGVNALITDPARRINSVAIASVTTRFAMYKKKPLLLLDHHDVDASTAIHEAGHALFDALRFSFKAQPDVALRVADIHARLSATAAVNANERKAGRARSADHPAGLWIFDPSQWSKTLNTEHPWDDPDELFASALEAHRTDRKGVEKAIAKFARRDPAAAAPARELLALIDGLQNAPTQQQALDQNAEATARAELERLRRAGTVEDTLDLSPTLKWALQPETMPQR